MDLRHLRYFVALAEERHFGRAARILNMAQPPLSQQIRALEAELQVKLFDRERRPVELTSAGRAFLHEARQILLHVDAARATAQRVAAGYEGRITIGVVGSAAFEFLPTIIRRFRERWPDVRLSVREMSSPDQLQALEDLKIDVGLLRPPVINPNLAARLIYQEPFVVALPADHPVSQARGIRLADLGTTALVIFGYEEAPGFRNLIMHFCQQAGYTPGVIQEANQMTTMIALVAAGIGAAIIPRGARRLDIEGVVFRPILDEIPLAELCAVWRKENENRAIRELTAIVDELRSL